MSDIAKKTLPPGSWPGGSKGATNQTADSTASAKSRPDNEPRSAPSPPADIFSRGGDSEKQDLDVPDEHGTTTTASDNFSDSGEYIHHDQAKPDDNKEPEEDKEKGSDVKYDKAEGEEQIQLQDNDKSEASEKSLKEVEPEPVSEKATPKASEAGEDVKEDAEGKKGTDTPASGASSKLTEEAKKAFDQASENQPTDEARESFLENAQGSEIPDRTKSATAPSEKPQEEDSQGVGNDIKQGEEQAVSEIQDKPSSAAPEETKSKAGEQTEEAAEKATDQADAATVDAPIPSVADDEKSEDKQSQIASEGPQQERSAGKPDSEQADEQQATVQEGEKPSQEEINQEDQLFHDQPPATDAQIEDQQSQQQDFGENQTQPEGQEGDGSTVAEQVDFSILKNGKVNKGGNVVSPDSNRVVGRVVSGILQYLVGKKVDENGDIWSDNGKVIGKAEPISDSERDEMTREPAPFESFPDATVDGNGMVVSNGEWVGKVSEGDPALLRGKQVDPDGDILDKGGNVIGKAVRWEPEPEEEPEPEAEVDKSILAGKRVNKAGNVVDSAGVIYGRVVEGDPKKMVGRMCDKKGNILSESGDVLGKADLVSEGEREGSKEGPFTELEGCTVAKDGTVVTPSGDIVGRLTKGEGKVLFGRAVDEDGDVLDKNGNVIGKAERWEPEAVEKSKNPMSGRKVNREGNVVDTDGNIVGKLTSGDLQKCAGKEIDDDGDVVDGKGTVIGHCSLLDDIPQEVEEESPEDKEKRETAERDKKLAVQMSVCIEQCLDKIRPITKMMVEKIDAAERQPEDERDEEQLVKEVRPLIEEGGRILEEAKGIIKGLDPDGRISANAKHKTAAREATPEEYHLADVLKDLTGDVTACIENCKKKLEGMPHAKKELNPLWGLLNEPLFQILAAVGLLLSGVLNLVGRLVSRIPIITSLTNEPMLIYCCATVERTRTRWSRRRPAWNPRSQPSPCGSWPGIFQREPQVW
ncbi:hypothetical protein QBC35DRAFT_485160 [Podospora australis]|uniref:DUF6987 domain-containing protein n=1 Tax=Podospora australis TaxID=1536484 RepID=A0AAN6X0S3_9PEZI|nr:hypothetical protein QBC35DRAFT_485160 [Podospora australis]